MKIIQEGKNKLSGGKKDCFDCGTKFEWERNDLEVLDRISDHGTSFYIRYMDYHVGKPGYVRCPKCGKYILVVS